MDLGTLGALIATFGSLVLLALSMLFTAVVTLLSMAIPLAIMGIFVFVLIKQLQSGRANLVVHNPLLQLAAAGATRQAPKRLKKVACRGCGGSKVLPPRTAWVYCDYCGAMVDWDFQIACRTAGSAKPGPAYEALQRKEVPLQNAAKASGDRDAYRDSTRRVFDAHFTACPGAWSPRLGDPDYRAALLELTADHYTAAAFDPTCAALETAQNDAVKALKWIPAFPMPKADPRSFEALTDAVIAFNSRFVAVAEPLLDRHPDGVSLELMRATARSAFAQGWMQYLDKAGQDAMIGKLELGGEYIDVPDIAAVERHCGGCGKGLLVAPGAKKVICEHCGHGNDVGHPEITCTGCGGPVSVIWSKRAFRCPSCATELRVD